jgi:hypothetical protein
MTNSSIHPLGSRRSLVIRLLVLCLVFEVCFTRSPNVEASNSSVEQALIITIPFDGKSGSNEEVERLYKMEAELINAIEHSHAGEYDGNEISEKTFTMYAYGPSANKLFDVALPVLAKYRLPAGSRAVKRYGKPGAREERVPLSSGAVN